jgi:hypothetical protein
MMMRMIDAVNDDDVDNGGHDDVDVDDDRVDFMYMFDGMRKDSRERLTCAWLFISILVLVDISYLKHINFY